MSMMSKRVKGCKLYNFANYIFKNRKNINGKKKKQIQKGTTK